MIEPGKTRQAIRSELNSERIALSYLQEIAATTDSAKVWAQCDIQAERVQNRINHLEQQFQALYGETA